MKKETSFLNLTGHYFKVAGRNFIKHKSLSLLNVLGLSLSMAIGMLAITIIEEQYSFDNFHENKEEIYRVLSGRQGNFSFASSPPLLGPEMETGLPDVKAVATFSTSAYQLEVGNEVFKASGVSASSDFFEVFTFPLLKGDGKSLDDPASILITEKTAKRLFGYDNPLGQFIKIRDSVEVKVGGVLKDIPHNSHLKFDFVSSDLNTELESKVVNKDWSNIYTYYNYVLFNQEYDLSRAQRFMDQASEKHYDQQRKNGFIFQPFGDIYPGRSYINSPSEGSPEPVLFKIIGGVSLVIIIFATFNYASLTTARSFTRAKEIGVRKTFGAHSKHISIQVLIESIFISLVAGLLAIPLLKLIIPGILSLNEEIAHIFLLKPGITTYLYFLLFAVFVGTLAGAIPAVYFSKFQTVQVLRDFYSVRVFSKVGLRKFLIIFQLVLGLLCVSTALLTQKQFKYELNFDRGFNADGLVNIDINSNNLNVFRNEIEKSSNILGTSFSTNVPSSSSSGSLSVNPPDGGERVSVNFFRADEAFFDLYQLATIGEALVSSKEFDAPQVTLNESAVGVLRLGTPTEALGTNIFIGGKSRRVVRVIKDFYFQGINTAQRPLMILPLYETDNSGVLSVKVVNNKVGESLRFIDKVWLKTDAKTHLNYLIFQDKLKQSSPHLIMTKVVGFFGVQLLLVALIGLSGICKWMAEIRAREMGIRKILGAETSQLIISLSKGFLLLTALSILIALPLSYVANTEIWLNSLVNRIEFNLEIVVASTLILTIPAILLMLLPALLVLRRNPTYYIKAE